MEGDVQKPLPVRAATRQGADHDTLPARENAFTKCTSGMTITYPAVAHAPRYCFCICLFCDSADQQRSNGPSAIVGTCEEMCPAVERDRRGRLNDIQVSLLVDKVMCCYATW